MIYKTSPLFDLLKIKKRVKLLELQMDIRP